MRETRPPIPRTGIIQDRLDEVHAQQYAGLQAGTPEGIDNNPYHIDQCIVAERFEDLILVPERVIFDATANMLKKNRPTLYPESDSHYPRIVVQWTFDTDDVERGACVTTQLSTGVTSNRRGSPDNDLFLAGAYLEGGWDGVCWGYMAGPWETSQAVSNLLGVQRRFNRHFSRKKLWPAFVEGALGRGAVLDYVVTASPYGETAESSELIKGRVHKPGDRWEEDWRTTRVDSEAVCPLTRDGLALSQEYIQRRLKMHRPRSPEEFRRELEKHYIDEGVSPGIRDLAEINELLELTFS